MARSYDDRRYPAGPKVEPGKTSPLRGPKRVGPIGAIVPGDDVEVAREIERLWAALRRKRSPGQSGPDHLVALWFFTTTPTATGAQGGVWRVPQIAGNNVNFNLTSAFVRMEDSPSSSYAFRFEKSEGGGAFSAVTLTTVTVASGEFESEDVSNVGSVQSGDLLRINVTTVGAGSADLVTCQLEGDVQ